MRLWYKKMTPCDRRGSASPEEFAALAIAAYRAADEHGIDARMACMHADMARRLDELQQWIQRLDRSLRERSATPALAPR